MNRETPQALREREKHAGGLIGKMPATARCEALAAGDQQAGWTPSQKSEDRYKTFLFQ
jgi:hypothetical protein